jgi:acyl-CoA dehydrogenase
MSAHWQLPFFEDRHRSLAKSLHTWMQDQHVHEADDRAACREWVQRLGDAGWLRYVVTSAHGGAWDTLDSRALVIIRETMSRFSPLADFAFAMQGLGSGAISLAGSAAQQAHYLPAVARGEMIAAFALSEPEAGSDVAGMQTHAASTADGFVVNGCKTWISNGGLAHFYVVFAKTDVTAGARGITAFIVDADRPGLNDDTHLHVMSPHPLATLHFDRCALPASSQLGDLNGGVDIGAGADASEDPLLLGQPAGHGESIIVRHGEHFVHHVEMQVVGHEPRASSLNFMRPGFERLARTRLGDDW